MIQCFLEETLMITALFHLIDSRMGETKGTNALIQNQRLFLLSAFCHVQSRPLTHELFRAFLTLCDYIHKSFYSHLYHPFLYVYVPFCSSYSFLSSLIPSLSSILQQISRLRHILPQSQQKPEHNTRSPIFFCVPFSFLRYSKLLLIQC